MELMIYVAGELSDAFTCTHILVAEAALALVNTNLSINSASNSAACPLKVRLVRVSRGGGSLSN